MLYLKGEHFEIFYDINRVEINGIKITEIYCKSEFFSRLDFVIIFFNYNKQSHIKVSDLITEYQGKKAKCIIGCVAIDENIYPDNVFSALMKQFDLYLNSASLLDFENLVEFCTPTETDGPILSARDMKSASGTEIHIVTEESNSINELKKLVSGTCRKLFSHREQKFPKVMITFLTNGYELLLDEVKELLDSLDRSITGNNCLWGVNDKVPGLDNKTIRVSLIFYEG